MMTDQPAPFATWLAMTMQRHQLTQADLAREVGVADAQVSRWRRGQAVPTVRYLQRLADTFSVPRATLDRLAGYPVDAASPLPGGAEATDAMVLAERQAYEARFGRLLEKRLPRSMWPAYLEACEALAAALVASFETALATAHQVADDTATDDAGKRRPRGPVGFGP